MIRLFTLFIFLFSLVSHGVEALSKQETFEGCIVEYAIIRSDLIKKKPTQVLYRITVDLKEGQKPAFKKTSNIQILSKASIPSWIFGRWVKVNAYFSGNKKDGNYWLNSLSVIKEETCDF